MTHSLNITHCPVIDFQFPMLNKTRLLVNALLIAGLLKKRVYVVFQRRGAGTSSPIKACPVPAVRQHIVTIGFQNAFANNSRVECMRFGVELIGLENDDNRNILM